MAARRKSRAKPKAIVPSRTSIFGPAPLLQGEDAAAYHELLEQVSEAVKPSDLIEEILVHDVVDLTWEILRLRRIKSSFISKALLDLLESILEPLLRPKAEKSEPKTGEANFGLQLPPFVVPAQPRKSRDLVKRWIQRDPAATARINKLLSDAGMSMTDVAAQAFKKEFDNIERVERLLTVAEGRRNATLREIDRRRATLAQTLRASLEKAEDAEFEVIPSKGSNGKLAKNVA